MNDLDWNRLEELRCRPLTQSEAKEYGALLAELAEEEAEEMERCDQSCKPLLARHKRVLDSIRSLTDATNRLADRLEKERKA